MLAKAGGVQLAGSWRRGVRVCQIGIMDGFASCPWPLGGLRVWMMAAENTVMMEQLDDYCARLCNDDVMNAAQCAVSASQDIVTAPAVSDCSAQWAILIVSLA